MDIAPATAATPGVPSGITFDRRAGSLGTLDDEWRLDDGGVVGRPAPSVLLAAARFTDRW